LSAFFYQNLRDAELTQNYEKSREIFLQIFFPYDTVKIMKKIRLIAIISALTALILLALLIILSRGKKPLIAFYDLDKATIQALTKQLGEDYSYQEFDKSTSLSYQINKSKAAALFTRGKANIDQGKEAAAKKARLPLSTISGMSSSIRNMEGISDKKALTCLPLLIDHMEVNIDNRLLKSTKVAMPNAPSWNDLSTFAKAAAKKDMNPKIVFAGKDSGNFLDILGALAESIDGRSSYDSALQLIQIAKDSSNI